MIKKRLVCFYSFLDRLAYPLHFCYPCILTLMILQSYSNTETPYQEEIITRIERDQFFDAYS